MLKKTIRFIVLLTLVFGIGCSKKDYSKILEKGSFTYDFNYFRTFTNNDELIAFSKDREFSILEAQTKDQPFEKSRFKVKDLRLGMFPKKDNFAFNESNTRLFYLDDYGYLTITDISNSKKLHTLGKFEEMQFERLFFYADDNRVIVLKTGRWGDKVAAILDVSKPSKIKFLGYFDYQASSFTDMYFDLKGLYSYVIVNDKLIIYDLRDPADIRALSSTELPFETADNYFIGDYLILGNSYEDKIVFLDVTNKSKPDILTTIDQEFNGFNIYDYKDKPYYLFLRFDNFIKIYDLKKIVNHKLLGSITDISTNHSILAVEKNNIVLECFDFPKLRELSVYDISNPKNPYLAKSAKVEGDLHTSGKFDRYFYQLSGDSDFVWYNIFP